MDLMGRYPLTLGYGRVNRGVAGGGRGGGIENQAGASLDVSNSIFKDNQALGAPNGYSALRSPARPHASSPGAARGVGPSSHATP